MSIIDFIYSNVRGSSDNCTLVTVTTVGTMMKLFSSALSIPVLSTISDLVVFKVSEAFGASFVTSC